MFDSDIKIANRALARIGESAIVSFDDATDLAQQVSSIYCDVVDAAFGCYQWKWARRTGPLQRLTPPAPPPLVATPAPVPVVPPQAAYAGFPAAPAPYPDVGAAPGAQSFNGWPYGFGKPANALSQPLGLFVRWPSDPCRDFAVEGDEIYARVPVLYGTFVMRVDPASWPPNFRLGVVMWLAAEFAIPCTHDKDLAAQLGQAAYGSPSEQQRGGLMGRAIAMDVATGGPSAAFSQDPLTQARYEGPWYGTGGI